MKRSLPILATVFAMMLVMASGHWAGRAAAITVGYPELTLDEFVTALNRGDWAAASTYCTSRRCAHAPHDLDELESARLRQVWQASPAERRTEQAHRRDVHAVWILRTNLDLQFAGKPGGPQTMEYVLVQEQPGAPWLIDDWRPAR